MGSRSQKRGGDQIVEAAAAVNPASFGKRVLEKYGWQVRSSRIECASR